MDEGDASLIGHGEGYLDVAVDWGREDGLWVRIDTYLPAAQFYRSPPRSPEDQALGHGAWIGLTRREAEGLVEELQAAIDRIRDWERAQP